MKEVLSLFEQICTISHCSGETDALKAYLAAFCQKCGYRVQTDAAGNVAAYTPAAPKTTLQAHYDMVCIGKAPQIEIYEEEGWLRARDSSLGADNGIGVAMMLCLARKGAPVDLLFTNDEEIGLLGAQDLALPIRTDTLINLDTEEAGRVYIGCAGGEDIYAKRCDLTPRKLSGGRWFRLEAVAPGGHSGVNIADPIPNAVIELARAIYRTPEAEIAEFVGGERINAIPRRAEATIWLPEGVSFTPAQGVTLKERSAADEVVAEGRSLVAALAGFAHGVRAWNRALNLPQSSVNLAKVELSASRMEIALSVRAMENGELERLSASVAAGWEALGFDCRREGKYPAWKPERTPLAKKALALYKARYPDADMAAIHAGLECALFAGRYPDLQIVSLGPTILDPHSDRERLEIATVQPIMETLEALISAL